MLHSTVKIWDISPSAGSDWLNLVGHNWSDVDLAVWGLAPADYFEAVARVLDVGGDIKVDLIRAERCRPYLREAIEAGADL